MDGLQFLFSLSPVFAAWTAFIIADTGRVGRFFAVFGICVVAVFIDFASMRKESSRMRCDRDAAWSRLRDQSDCLAELSKILTGGGLTNEASRASVGRALQAYRNRRFDEIGQTASNAPSAERALLDELTSLRDREDQSVLIQRGPN